MTLNGMPFLYLPKILSPVVMVKDGSQVQKTPILGTK